jgi:hypothetical protein
MKLLLANSNMASEVASMVLAAAERFALPGTIRDRLRHLVRPRCHRRRNKAAVRWRAAGDPDDNIKPALARILDDILAGARREPSLQVVVVSSNPTREISRRLQPATRRVT